MNAELYGAVAAASIALLAILCAWKDEVFTHSVVTSRLRRDDRRSSTGGSLTAFLRSGLFIAICMAAAAVAALTAYGLIPAMVVAGLEVGGFAVLRSTLARRRVEAYERALPDALDDMARSLRSGSGFLVALREAGLRAPGDVGRDLRRVASDAEVGRGITPALELWRDETQLPSVRLCVAALTLALETGAAEAQAVDSVASTLRQTLDAAAAARTHATDAKASAMALTLMPVAITGPLLVFNSHARHFMLETTVGQALLVSGLVLDALGAWWMSTLIKRVLA